MTTNAIKHIIDHTHKCRQYGYNIIEIQTANRYFVIDERKGTLYELIEDSQLFSIYDGSETHHIDAAAILNISVNDADKN